MTHARCRDPAVPSRVKSKRFFPRRSKIASIVADAMNVLRVDALSTVHQVHDEEEHYETLYDSRDCGAPEFGCARADRDGGIRP
jgi:hypothetical protein